jgi:hypothetical protein
MTERLVPVSQEQAQILEDVAVQMMRDNDDNRAIKLLALSLAYKWAKPLEPPLPENVYPIVTHAGDYWSRKVSS